MMPFVINSPFSILTRCFDVSYELTCRYIHVKIEKLLGETIKASIAETKTQRNNEKLSGGNKPEKS